jgi:hypothetical protein
MSRVLYCSACQYAECRKAVYRYAECCGADKFILDNMFVLVIYDLLAPSQVIDKVAQLRCRLFQKCEL